MGERFLYFDRRVGLFIDRLLFVLTSPGKKLEGVLLPPPVKTSRGIFVERGILNGGQI